MKKLPDKHNLNSELSYSKVFSVAVLALLVFSTLTGFVAFGERPVEKKFDEAISHEKTEAKLDSGGGGDLKSTTLQPGPVEGKDTWISNVAGLEDSNYGLDQEVYVGHNNADEYRTLMEFDIPFERGRVKSADLYMYSSNLNNNDVNVGIYGASRPWEEGNTYGNPEPANWSHSGADVLLEEDFEGSFPPEGWYTTDDAGTGNVWMRNDEAGVINRCDYGSGYSAAAEASVSGTAWDTSLYSPEIYIPYSNANLTYASNFQDFAGNGDMWLDISDDGGSSWTNLRTQSVDDPAGGTFEVEDLSTYTGQNVILRWRYVAASSSAWFWHIDNVTINSWDSLTWTNPGGDYYPSPSSYRTVHQTGTWYGWNVTSIVNRWQSGTWENNGFLMKIENSPAGALNYAGFFSSDYTTDPSLRPVLLINYGMTKNSDIPDQYLEMNGPTKTVDLTDTYDRGIEHKAFETPAGSGNIIPFRGTTYDQIRHQSVYTPDQVGEEGFIRTISFRRVDENSIGTFDNLKIFLAHTELDNLTETFADNYDGELCRVFNLPTYELNASNDDEWISFPLNDNFTYDDSRNLLVEIRWDGDDGNSISLRRDSFGTVNKRVFNSSMGSTTGNADGTLINARFNIDVVMNTVKDDHIGTSYAPFMANSYNEVRSQILYKDDLIGHSGTIDEIAFDYANPFTDSPTFENFSIRMAHTTNEDLVNNYDDNPSEAWVEVLNISSYQMDVTPEYQWIDIDLENDFYYNGVDNLVMDIRYREASGDDIKLQIGPASYDAHLMDNSYSSSSGTIYNVQYNIYFTFLEDDGIHWHSQSLDPDLFTASIYGRELHITPVPNSRGMGTLWLTAYDVYGNKMTQEIDVNIGMKDIFIRNDTGQEYANYGGHEFMYAGDFTSSSELRSLLEFNLPPKKGELNRATVSLFCSDVLQPGEDVNVTLSPVTNDWTENNLTGSNAAVNWYNRTAGTPWNNPGGDYDPSYTSYRNISQTMVWYDWDVTEIVKAWYNEDLDNNGLMITGDDHGVAPYNYVELVTSDLSDDYYWPKVSITFGPEEVPDQTMQEDDPTKFIPLSTDYPSITQQSGPLNETNWWPFYGSRATCHYQSLYTPDQVSAEGEIKSISVKRLGMDVGQFSDLSISMAHTSVSSLSTTYGDNYEGMLVEVYSALQYETNSSDGDLWLTFDLNGNFTYDSSHNLLLDIKWNGSSGTVVPTYETADFTEYRRVFGNLGDSTGIGRDYDALTVKFETDFTDNGIYYRGTTGNVMPFGPGFAQEERLQMLYRDELMNCSGTIDKLYFQSTDSGLDWAVMENFTVKLAHSTNETLDTSLDHHNSSPMVEVMNYTRYNITSHGPGEWIELDIEDSFYYNGVDNLLIEFYYRGGYSRDLGVNIAYMSGATYDGRAYQIPPNPPATSTSLYNIVVEVKDNPYWQASSSDPSLFTTGISMGPNLYITPQANQSGSGTIDLRMSNCNGELLHQQDVGVTITPVNDAPVLSGPSTITADEDVDEVIDMSSYVSDIDNTIDELTFVTNSSYATVDGYNITFNYPQEVTHEMVNITVEDTGGLFDYAVADVTVNQVNDAPTLSGPSTITCDEDVDEVIDMSSYADDVDNTLDELTFATNSSYATVEGYNITFNYPEGVMEETVNITVEDPDGATGYTVVEVTVNPVNDPPILSGVPTPIDMDEGVAYELNMTSYVSDPDNDIADMTFDTNSSYATIDGHMIIFNYTGGVTGEMVNITVEDEGGLTDYAVIETQVTLSAEYPEVVSHSPTGSGVSPTSNVRIEFTMQMDTTSTEDAFSLMMGSTEISGTFSWNTGQTIMTFNPTDDLSDGDYEVTLTMDAESTVGTALTSEHSWTFSVSTEDSDGDGMADSWEEENGLDPTVDDSEEDADGDGISNIDEYNYGFDPQVDDAGEDSDGDGVSNLDEIQAGTNPTDPEDYISDEEDKDEDEGGIFNPLMLGLLIAAIAVVMLIIFFAMRKKPAEGPEPQQPEEESDEFDTPPPPPGETGSTEPEAKRYQPENFEAKSGEEAGEGFEGEPEAKKRQPDSYEH